MGSYRVPRTTPSPRAAAPAAPSSSVVFCSPLPPAVPSAVAASPSLSTRESSKARAPDRSAFRASDPSCSPAASLSPLDDASLSSSLSSSLPEPASVAGTTSTPPAGSFASWKSSSPSLSSKPSVSGLETMDATSGRWRITSPSKNSAPAAKLDGMWWEICSSRLANACTRATLSSAFMER